MPQWTGIVVDGVVPSEMENWINCLGGLPRSSELARIRWSVT